MLRQEVARGGILRDKCFRSLQVQIPEIIMEGLYLLAADFAVELAPNQQE
jgi:hypothetical protein